jgi:hypothetical protein
VYRQNEVWEKTDFDFKYINKENGISMPPRGIKCGEIHSSQNASGITAECAHKNLL